MESSGSPTILARTQATFLRGAPLALLAGAAAWIVAWATDPFLVLATGGVAGIPHLAPAFALGMIGLTWGSAAAWNMEPRTARLSRNAWACAMIGGALGLLATLASLLGGEPIMASLLVLPHTILILGALAFLGVDAAITRTVAIVPFALAVVARIVAFVLPYGNASEMPHHVPEAVAQTAAAVAFGIAGWQLGGRGTIHAERPNDARSFVRRIPSNGIESRAPSPARLLRLVVASLAIGVLLAMILNRQPMQHVGPGLGQVLLVLSGAMAGALVMHPPARQSVLYLGCVAFGLAAGMSWTAGALYWAAVEPLTHPGSNPLYGRQSLVVTVTRDALTPLWGVTLAAAMALIPPSRRSRGRWVAAGLLSVYYAYLLWQVPGVWQSYQDLPGSYEWRVGVIVLSLLFLFSAPVAWATLQAFRNDGSSGTVPAGQGAGHA